MQDKIDEIMDYFDFERVEKVMNFLNWKWVDSNNNLYVPDIYDIKRFARKLLREACERKMTISTGGFKVTYYESSDLELEFIIADWYTENE